MSEDQAVEVVITAPDAEWLRELARELVHEQLCAAAHLSPFDTIYRWRGEIEEKPETRAVLYTRASLVDRIVEWVHLRQPHPYEVAHVTATAIIGGNPDYLAWIEDETSH